MLRESSLLFLLPSLSRSRLPGPCGFVSVSRLAFLCAFLLGWCASAVAVDPSPFFASFSQDHLFRIRNVAIVTAVPQGAGRRVLKTRVLVRYDSGPLPVSLFHTSDQSSSDSLPREKSGGFEYYGLNYGVCPGSTLIDRQRPASSVQYCGLLMPPPPLRATLSSCSYYFNLT